MGSRYPVLPYSTKLSAQINNFKFGYQDMRSKKRSVDVDVALDLLKYCEITRVRDPVLLDACADAFITNFSTVSEIDYCITVNIFLLDAS